MTSLVSIQRRVGVAPDGKWGPATAAAVAKALGMGAGRALGDKAAFYAAIRARPFGGTLRPEQFEGVQRSLAFMGEAGWSTAWTAYGLATKYHETAATMAPVREGLDASDAWRRAHLRYYPWYGRGDVQLTWERNYRLADEKLGLGGTLVANPDRALEPDLAAQIMVRGMEEGWFSGKALGDFLPEEIGTTEQFTKARPIINGTDRAALIAGYATRFQSALVTGGWA